jgi:hypothetical protein
MAWLFESAGTVGLPPDEQPITAIMSRMKATEQYRLLIKTPPLRKLYRIIAEDGVRAEHKGVRWREPGFSR